MSGCSSYATLGRPSGVHLLVLAGIIRLNRRKPLSQGSRTWQKKLRETSGMVSAFFLGAGMNLFPGFLRIMAPTLGSA